MLFFQETIAKRETGKGGEGTTARDVHRRRFGVGLSQLDRDSRGRSRGVDGQWRGFSIVDETSRIVGGPRDQDD